MNEKFGNNQWKVKLFIFLESILIVGLVCVVISVMYTGIKTKIMENYETKLNEENEIGEDSNEVEKRFTEVLVDESMYSEEGIKYIDENKSNSGVDTLQEHKMISMTKQEVKIEEERIRSVVNGGSTKRVDYLAGEDGCVWNRRYEFEDGVLIFAYYYEAMDGSPDQRYYFKNGYMIEWIPYTGNGAPDECRYYVSDNPLEDSWYTVEYKVLLDAKCDY